jgi:hypothetical protein
LALASLPVAAGDRDVCAFPPYADVQVELTPLFARLTEILPRYPSLQDAWASHRPTICFTDSPSEAIGAYEPATDRIEIHRALPPDFRFAILIHELRHVEQNARGICPSPSLSMREYARATWALEADASVVTILVAWDLRNSGDPGPWNALADWPGEDTLAAVFSDAMTETGNLAIASARVFESWYENSDRREDYYIASCSLYLEEQERSHALPAYGEISDTFFERLCRLPDGTRFDCVEPPGLVR